MDVFIENEDNATYFILDGFVELHRYKYLYFFLLLIVYFFVFSFNSVIIYIISITKSLHEPMYIFIACLLLNALMVITTIYPKLLIDFLSEKHHVSYSACLFQAFLVYSFGSAEFSLLSVMAYDRYVSICKPLQYHTVFGMKTVKIMLLSSWLWPFVQITVLAIMIRLRAIRAKVCEHAMDTFFCDAVTLSKVNCGWAVITYYYGMYLMISVVFLPLFFIVFTYARILVVCLQNSQEFRKKAIQTCLPHLLVLFNFSLLAVFDILKYEMFYDRTVLFALALQLITYPYLFNPIIYGWKMQEISKRLKKLLGQLKLNKTIS